MQSRAGGKLLLFLGIWYLTVYNFSCFYTLHSQDQDEGTYFCTAHNTIGSDEIQHTISISRPPSSVSLVLGYITTNSIQVHWDSPISDPQLSGWYLFPTLFSQPLFYNLYQFRRPYVCFLQPFIMFLVVRLSYILHGGEDLLFYAHLLPNTIPLTVEQAFFAM